MSTSASSRAAMEAAVAVLYQCLDEAPPDRVVWFSSPHALLAHRTQHAASAASIYEVTINRAICLPEEVQNLIDDVIEPDPTLSQRFWHIFLPSVVVDALRVAARTKREVGYCAEMDWAQYLARCFFINGRRGLLPLLNAWFLPYADRCLISEPHTALHLDDAGLPHNTVGPAITYPDGWGVYAVHGTVVPPEWITKPNALTPETALHHENMEQRRAACELLGWERILRELDARTIDADPDPRPARPRFTVLGRADR